VPPRYVHRLVLLGLSLFLISLIIGMAIPRFAVPRLALSAHLIGLLQGIFLIVIGMLWPRLSFGPIAAGFAFWLLVYGCLAAWAANLLAAVLGAGTTIVPMAAGGAHGSATEELTVMLILRSGGVALIAALALLVWGARRWSNGESRSPSP
jgi:hydroxylaminobenzene mutase